MLGICAVTVFGAWVVFASGSLVVQSYMIEERDQRLTDIGQAYNSLNGELVQVQQRFLTATEAIEAKHDQLARMVDQKRSIEKRLQTGGAPNTKKKSTPAGNDRSAPNGGTAGGTSDVIMPRFVGVGGRLASVMESQSDLIAQIQERTKNNVSDLESAIQVTGLDLDRLLPEAALGGPAMGGPLVRLPDWEIPSRMDDGFDQRVQVLASHLSRLSGLESAVQSLPLIPPVHHYYVSSKFGKRRDPVTRQWSMHAGLDLAGVRRTPVVATAPGVVTFARRKGPYGKMVEIDHGQGLKTRYGHLHKILVKKGEKVGFRQKIGQMGSTGRTTGPHVHYEVWVDGKPRNPAKFLKAGQYVFRK
jgi:murein DD-endopeptidase MepM/ murein hydrolase activator NlpD